MIGSKDAFRKHTSRYYIAEVSCFVLVAVLVLEMWASKSYAMDESGNVRWELVYVSADHGCTNYQYMMADAYDELTGKYLDLYKFGNSSYPPQCMSDKNYAYYKVPADVDLLILVYDDQIANVELHTNDVGGFYTHVGHDRTRDHVIVICDCSNFEFSSPAFTLSHELSHFVTYYLGFGMTVESHIHTLAAKYNQCVEGEWDNSTCPGVVTYVYGKHYFTQEQVLVPYGPAVGKALVMTGNNATNNTEDIAGSELVMGVQKEVTKWWLEGKINDTDYSTVLGYILTRPDKPQNPDSMPDNILLASGRDGQEENSTYYNLGEAEDKKTEVLLKRVPFKLENVTFPDGTMPEWFRIVASGWAYNQSLSNQDFVDKITYLFGMARGR